MKILFLDIDYVLNSHKWEITRLAHNEPYVPYYSDLDPACLKLLEKVLDAEPELKIVISSSWRDSLNLKQFKEIFASFKFPVEKMIDVISPNKDKVPALEEYLASHPQITKFVIIDDDSLFALDHPLFKNFYKVATTGLRDLDVAGIIDRLNKPDTKLA